MNPSMVRLLAGATLAILTGLAHADPLSPPSAGQALLEANCARCHAIGADGKSPLDKAPPFRTLARKYPLDNLSEALAEGIMTGHPAMPQFTFTPTEIGAILSYLEQIGGRQD